ncbi:MAG: S8 family serine peptidase [Candidatus Marithrix sp.]|nr:S8 family serine peptidase [Candidatus Marithrix sp.]
MPKKTNLLLIIFILIGMSNNLSAERVLVHLSDSLKIDKLTQTYIIWDLRPIPWLVLEIPNVRRNILVKNIDWQADRQGHFASSLSIPNDPNYKKQWHLEEIGVTDLWQETQGEGITIALLDSGVDPNHPDLKDNILFEQGYDFGDQDAEPNDSNGHGTAMAGLIVASCNNKIGGCGVAPKAKLIPYKINKSGNNSFFESDLAAAIKAAADSSAQILSLSLVLDSEYSQIIQDALLYAKSKNKIIVAAAGNSGDKVAYPANIPWVIGVGAIDKKGQRLHSSNYGDGLSLMAPGTELLTTLPGTGYADWYDGTSSATALVSGVLALMANSSKPTIFFELAVDLLANCKDINSIGFDKESGFGHLRATKHIVNNNLNFSSTSAKLLFSGDIFNLDLILQGLSGKNANLYLKINFPTIDKRLNLYKIWKSDDNSKKIAYNTLLAVPYPLDTDLVLPLYGTPVALLENGIISSEMDDGFYELSALLEFIDDSPLQVRKIIYLSSY